MGFANATMKHLYPPAGDMGAVCNTTCTDKEFRGWVRCEQIASLMGGDVFTPCLYMAVSPTAVETSDKRYNLTYVAEWTVQFKGVQMAGNATEDIEPAE